MSFNKPFLLSLTLLAALGCSNGTGSAPQGPGAPLPALHAVPDIENGGRIVDSMGDRRNEISKAPRAMREMLGAGRR